jgi:hypothetical protein
MPICKARKTNGIPCRAPAIRGGAVCVVHGGAAPQVKAKAQERLLSLVAPALATLSKLIKTKNEAVALGACKDVLDRSGLKPDTRLIVEETVTTDVKILAQVFSREELEDIVARIEKAAIGTMPAAPGLEAGDPMAESDEV